MNSRCVFALVTAICCRILFCSLLASSCGTSSESNLPHVLSNGCRALDEGRANDAVAAFEHVLSDRQASAAQRRQAVLGLVSAYLEDERGVHRVEALVRWAGRDTLRSSDYEGISRDLELRGSPGAAARICGLGLSLQPSNSPDRERIQRLQDRLLRLDESLRNAPTNGVLFDCSGF